MDSHQKAHYAQLWSDMDQEHLQKLCEKKRKRCSWTRHLGTLTSHCWPQELEPMIYWRYFKVFPIQFIRLVYKFVLDVYQNANKFSFSRFLHMLLTTSQTAFIHLKIGEVQPSMSPWDFSTNVLGKGWRKWEIKFQIFHSKCCWGEQMPLDTPLIPTTWSSST